MNNILEEFFTYNIEERLNISILYRKFSISDIEDYFYTLLNIPLHEFVNYIKYEDASLDVTVKDVFQFSNFENASVIICKKHIEIDNLGLKHLEIGKLLLDDGKIRNVNAYRKYGENHAKTAVAFGLMFESYNTYYVSCMGYMLNNVSPDVQRRIIERLIIRSNLIKYIIKNSDENDFILRDHLFFLSDSTYNRRKSNIKLILNVLQNSKECSCLNFINSIIV